MHPYVDRRWEIIARLQFEKAQKREKRECVLEKVFSRGQKQRFIASAPLVTEPFFELCECRVGCLHRKKLIIVSMCTVVYKAGVVLQTGSFRVPAMGT